MTAHPIIGHTFGSRGTICRCTRYIAETENYEMVVLARSDTWKLGDREPGDVFCVKERSVGHTIHALRERGKPAEHVQPCGCYMCADPSVTPAARKRVGFATLMLPIEAIDRLRAIAAATALPGMRPSASATARAIIDAAGEDGPRRAPAAVARGGVTITLPVESIHKLQTIADRTGAACAATLAALIAETRIPRKRVTREPSAEALAALSPAHRATYLARMETPQPTYDQIAQRPEIRALNLKTGPSVKYVAEQAIKLLHG